MLYSYIDVIAKIKIRQRSDLVSCTASNILELIFDKDDLIGGFL